jgi:hypothetical protein
MKKIFSRKNSSFILFLLLFILVLSVRSGKYTYLVNSIFFITLFFTYKTRITVHAFYYLLLIGILTIWGIILGNDYISIIEDVFSLSPLILLFIEKEKFKLDLKNRLPFFLVNSLYFLIPLSLLIFNYMDYQIGGLSTKRFDYNVATKLSLFGPILPIIFGPTLIFFIDLYNKKQKALVFISMSIIMIMGIITLSKSVILTPIIYLFLFYGYKIFVNKKVRQLPKAIILIVFAGFLLIQFNVFEKIGLANAVVDSIERSAIQNQNSSFSSGRVEETIAYLNQDLTFLEHLIGRGLGGRKVRNNSNDYVGGINMLHFGPSHVFMKGGIILVLVLYLPLFFAVFRFWNTPNYYISLILISFFLANIQTTNWSWGIGTFFYWYGISMYFSTVNKNKYLISKKHVI